MNDFLPIGDPCCDCSACRLERARQEIALLRAETAELRGALQAADERLLKAGERVGLIFGCDTPAAMADEIARLRAENDAMRTDISAAKQVIADIVESEVEPNRADAERYRNLCKWDGKPFAATDTVLVEPGKDEHK